MTTRYDADAVVIGAGIAGLSACMELLERKRKVLLIDRDRRENLGGLAKESFGVIFAVDTPEQRRMRIQDSPELAFQDWCSFGELSQADGHGFAWAKRYVEMCRSEVYDWLKIFGVKFTPALLWAERGRFAEGNSVPRHHLAWGTGREVIKKLLLALEAHPSRNLLELAFQHRVDRLESQAGVITGCSGIDECSGQEFVTRAGCVIVAAGGTNGSEIKARANWDANWGKRAPEQLLNGSHQYATGRLHDAVAAAGGRLRNLDRNWNYAAGVPHPSPRKPRHGISLVPCKSALWLDASGRRFGPEPLVPGFDTRYLIERICRDNENKGLPKHSWQLMNYEIMRQEFAISGAEFNDALRERDILGTLRLLLRGDTRLADTIIASSDSVVTGDDLATLASRMQLVTPEVRIDTEGLVSDVRHYDAAVSRGERFRTDFQLVRLEQLRGYRPERGRIASNQTILHPRGGPLVAIKLNIISRKSLGGIETNLDSAVVGAEGQILAGLYAAGEAAGFGGGGCHGLRSLESTFLGTAILTGRAAGQHAANYI